MKVPSFAKELQKHELPTEENPDNQEAEEEGKSEVQELKTADSPQPTEQSQLEKPSKNLAKGILISIPYAATIGGISTLTGTPPNLILDGQLKRSLIKRKSTESEIKAKAVIHSEFAQLGPMTCVYTAVNVLQH
ncbi:hypothetical protein chiPu_0001680 [Chiloscyllium punctatum]|uniref:Uncharacterized protein n=1 Tax=Chiloscyllium punctatum TaxID=137246 RepID=A0A401RYR8_CHIPU|nr:hypothetical protein [Chiloscyllium punctatum]